MANRYWIGGSGNWSDTAHWSTSSGGSGGASKPGSGDQVFIDADSGGGTITIDEAQAHAQGIITTGLDEAVTIDGNGKIINIYGALTLTSYLTIIDATIPVWNSTTITITGDVTDCAFTMNGMFPTYTLGAALSCKSLNCSPSPSGTFNSADYDITTTGTVVFGSGAGGDLGTSTVTCSSYARSGSLDDSSATIIEFGDGTAKLLPLLEIYGELDAHQAAWIPTLAIFGEMDVQPFQYVSGIISIPLQTVSGVLVWGQRATLEQKIPAIRGGIKLENPVGFVYGYEAGGSGAYLEKSIPKITLSAGATREGSANLSKAISRITLSASAHTDTSGALSAAIPAIRISATGTIGQVASLSKPIPMVRLTASAIAGMIGSLQKSIPAIRIDANSYWLSGASLQKAIPAIRISARVEGVLAEIIALALNTKNFGLSKYTSYPYNSMCVFNGKVLGAKSGGLYELSGATDDGTNIEWKLRTPLINLEKNKLRNVWLHGKLSGDIKMIVETADGDRYEYDAEPVNEHEDAVRVKVGRGLDVRYIIIEFQNESDQVVTVDKIEGFGVKL